MRRTLLALAAAAAAAVATFAATPDANAANHFIMLQGRGWKSWNGELPNVSGWTNVVLNYNGSAALNDSTVNGAIKNAIASYCANGHSCVIHCYSAGCLRMVKAVDELRKGGNSLPGLWWAEASASAAGGTKLAELSTQGWTKWIAKLLGQQEKIDFSLTPSAARSVEQGNMGATVYHIAGRKNICKKLWFVKLCANKYVGVNVADGVVGGDSASGASVAGNLTNGDHCAVAKYPWRTYDSGYSSCYGDDRDHFGVPGQGTAILGKIFGGSWIDENRNWSNESPTSSTAECTDGASNKDYSCDAKFAANQNYANKPTSEAVATPISPSVDKSMSGTTVDTVAGTCAGKCGGSGGYNSSMGKTCWCDSVCHSYGDCCPDYSTASCNYFNQ